MHQRRRLPGICWHRSLQRWYMTLDGKQFYLSGRMERTPTPPPEVRAAYDRTLARWLAERAFLPEPCTPDPTLDELWLSYLAVVEAGPKYHKDGKPTSQVQLIKDACRVAARLFGTEPARDFGPLKLEMVRGEFVKFSWTRETINAAVTRIRRMFRWGVSRELIPETTYRALKSLPDLTRAEHPHEQRQIGDVPDTVLVSTRVTTWGYFLDFCRQLDQARHEARRRRQGAARGPRRGRDRERRAAEARRRLEEMGAR